jgi:protein-disulfide isomerase
MRLTAALFAAGLAAASSFVALPGFADEFTPAQKQEMGAFIREYLVNNPDVLREAIEALDKRDKATAEADRQKIVATEAGPLFSSKYQATIGNPKANATLVEFFDYNCHFCKGALPTLMQLMKDDGKLKVVLKEFPVLGPGSVEAAKVAVAVRMQDKTGKKYLDFHQKLLGGRGQADKARALAVAKEVGMDMARLEKDMGGEEVRVSLEESLKLAETLGLNGTPSYVVGNDVVVGAVGLDALRGKISTARCGKESC